MERPTVHRLRAGPVLLLFIVLTLLTACEIPAESLTPASPPPGGKPSLSFVKPDNGSSFSINDRVPIDAIAQAESGILRVDFLVNGALADSVRLTITSRRFEYQTGWRPDAVGQYTLTLIAYDVNDVASDPVSIAVAVGVPTATSTPAPGAPTFTPFILVVTNTPLPTPTPTATPYIIVVTATPPPTRTPTLTPRIIVLTATFTATPTP